MLFYYFFFLLKLTFINSTVASQECYSAYPSLSCRPCSPFVRCISCVCLSDKAVLLPTLINVFILNQIFDVCMIGVWVCALVMCWHGLSHQLAPNTTLSLATLFISPQVVGRRRIYMGNFSFMQTIIFIRSTSEIFDIYNALVKQYVIAQMTQWYQRPHAACVWYHVRVTPWKTKNLSMNISKIWCSIASSSYSILNYEAAMA